MPRLRGKLVIRAATLPAAVLMGSANARVWAHVPSAVAAQFGRRGEGMRKGVPYLTFMLVVAWVVLVSPDAYASENDKTFYGINEDPLWNYNPDEIPKFVTMLKETGCGSVRIPIRWRVVEPQKGEGDYAALDRIVALIPQDIEILGLLMSVPQWANGADPNNAEGWFDAYPPKDIEDWRQFVSRTVGHFSHRIKHWEIWNEENGVDFYRPHPDAEDYTELLKVAYSAAKNADPECVIVLGGLQMNGIIPNPWSEVKVSDYLEDLYKAGARPYFDVSSTHPYVLPNEGADYMMKLVRDTLSLMARYGDGDKPLWITEVGCGAMTEEAEQAQARLLADTFEAAAKEARVQRVFWFALRDTQKDLLGPEGSMGVFDYQGNAKPALRALALASGTADGTQQSPAGDIPKAAMEDWRQFVSETVAHFSHMIKQWEIWNEHNGVDFYGSHQYA